MVRTQSTGCDSAGRWQPFAAVEVSHDSTHQRVAVPSLGTVRAYAGQAPRWRLPFACGSGHVL
eukprot:scaffold66079_cov60-Phaeocystis_antarctica.AAC.7